MVIGSDFQKLARLRVREAKALLDSDCYEGAYYLLGYAIECALKASIAKRIRRHEFPDKKLVNDIYTHNLSQLLSVSGLEPAFRRESAIDKELAANWATVKDWKEDSRYLHSVPASRAKDFYEAVVNRRSGILSWLKKSW